MIEEQSANDLFSIKCTQVLIALRDPGWSEAYLLAGSLLCLLLAAVIWRQREANLKRRIEQLRKQIAENFHDELGGKLTVITMYSELIRREVPEEQEMARHYLHKIAQASSGLYLAMKDLLWALDPARDRLDDLLLKIRDFGEDLFEDSPTDFSMQGIPGKSSEVVLPLEYKRHLLLLVKEGLHNVLRHACATQVILRAEIENGRLKIELDDNGKGFDQTRAPAGEGLKNMQSRVDKIRGQLQITSAGGRGTTIVVHCPLGRA